MAIVCKSHIFKALMGVLHETGHALYERYLPAPHARQPVGRMGRPDEVAYMALYLSSAEAEFVTGSAMTVDGGWTAA